MSNLAEKLSSSVIEQCAGTVVRREGETLVVGVDGREVRTRRAVSCLVEPKVDDRVLIARRGWTGHVIAVLERDEGAATIVVDGDLDLSVPHGKLRMVARDGVDLVSPGEVQVLANALSWHANQLKVSATEVVTVASRVLADLATTKLKGGVIDRVFDRVSERVKRSYRTVEELDQVRAKQVDYQASETMSLRSENMVATAKELVKVDGEQIHFG
jgi:hypothetical protein